jgi:hypothetical protein
MGRIVFDRSLSRVAGFLLVVFLIGLSPRHAEAIAFGEVTAQPEIVARIALGEAARPTFATGTFITPEWLLTAAHVVEALPGGAFVETAFGDFAIAAALRHPLFTPAALVLGYDVGLIRITAPLPAGLAYPTLAGDDLDDLLGLETLFLGFGLNESGEDTGERRQATAAIRFAFPETFGFYSDILGAEPYLRPGDSGGPAFAMLAGGEALLGVASYSLFLGDLAGSGFSPLAPARDFIDRTVAGVRWSGARLAVSEPAGLVFGGLLAIAALRRRVRHQGSSASSPSLVE